jgi:hypothetical protein
MRLKYVHRATDRSLSDRRRHVERAPREWVGRREAKRR